jgi:Lrp/AsnC family transcriptional regulator, leucine-responsive regulatory protein
MKKELDSVDQSIVKLLQINARMSISDIARKVHRSRTAVETRIEKLEETGVIHGYCVILAPAITRPPQHQAFIIIKHTGASDCEAVWQQLRRFKNIIECHSLFGHLDLIVKVDYWHLEELMEIKDFLSINPRVKEAAVSPVIKTWLPEPHQTLLATPSAPEK